MLTINPSSAVWASTSRCRTVRPPGSCATATSPPRSRWSSWLSSSSTLPSATSLAPVPKQQLRFPRCVFGVCVFNRKKKTRQLSQRAINLVPLLLERRPLASFQRCFSFRLECPDTLAIWTPPGFSRDAKKQIIIFFRLLSHPQLNN